MDAGAQRHPRLRPLAVAYAALLGMALTGCAQGPSPSPSGVAPAAQTGSPAVATPSAGPSSSATGAPTVGPTSAASPTPTARPTPTPTPRRTPKPTPTPTPRPTPKPTPKLTPTPAPTPTPTPAPAGWDPNHVSVRFTTVATVPGQPLAIANAGDGSGRLFVADKGGRIYVISGSTVLPTPFLDISAKVSTGGEQGLLGLAFHPRYPADPRVFVDYTNTAGDTVVSSFTVSAANPNAVDPGSEVVVLGVDQPYENHNGGTIQFGRDGYLYIALGDGGSGGDPLNNAQNLGTLLGNILRIDIDHAAGGNAYAIPASNPFVGSSGARGEIWLYGLRNPFRFSFDRATGDLWIGDVGQNAWEEIDVARAGVSGLDFGWRVLEGNHCYSPSTGCSTAGMTAPVIEYAHTYGCAVIGGNVYRGSAYPVLRGGYVFADECTGITWAISAAANGPQALVKVADGPGGIAGFGEDEAGELYAAALGGQVYRVSAVAR
jgi:glucose/arabinose dehydrogenase